MQLTRCALGCAVVRWRAAHHVTIDIITHSELQNLQHMRKRKWKRRKRITRIGEEQELFVGCLQPLHKGCRTVQQTFAVINHSVHCTPTQSMRKRVSTRHVFHPFPTSHLLSMIKPSLARMSAAVIRDGEGFAVGAEVEAEEAPAAAAAGACEVAGVEVVDAAEAAEGVVGLSLVANARLGATRTEAPGTFNVERTAVVRRSATTGHTSSGGALTGGCKRGQASGAQTSKHGPRV